MKQIILANDWVAKTMGDTCHINIGGTPSRSNSDLWDRDKLTKNLWVSIRDLANLKIEDTEEYISDVGIRKSNVKKVPKGTILMSFKLTIGRIGIAMKDLYTNEAIAALIPKNSLTNNYLYYGLQHWDLLSNVDQAIKGATLNKEKIKSLRIYFPKSTKEQEKIASILSTIDSSIEKTEQIINKYKSIKQGLMQDLFRYGIDENGQIRSENTHKFKGSPLGRIPEEWDVNQITQITEKMWIGLVTTMTKYYVLDGISLIRNQNIRQNTISKIDLIYLDTKFANKYESRKLRKGDIVTVHTGDIGTSAVITEEFDGSHGFATVNTRVNKLRVNENYLCWYFNTKEFRKIVDNLATGDGRSNLNLKDFIKLNIPAPKRITEQVAIAELLEAQDQTILKEELYKKKLFSIKQGLMQDLLTGKVRVNHLID